MTDSPIVRALMNQGVDSLGYSKPGNIDLARRPVVRNRDGSISTVRSISVGTERGEVLIPTVVGGRVVSDRQAIQHYRRTGENLGTFPSSALADAAAQRIHLAQAARYTQPSGRAIPPAVSPLAALLAQKARGL